MSVAIPREEHRGITFAVQVAGDAESHIVEPAVGGVVRLHVPGRGSGLDNGERDGDPQDDDGLGQREKGTGPEVLRYFTDLVPGGGIGEADDLRAEIPGEQ